MKKTVIIIFLCLFMGLLFSNGMESDNNGLNNERKEVSEVTKEVYEAFLNRMTFKDSQEKAFATKGFITQPEQLEISDSEGEIIWTQEAFRFLEGEEWHLSNVHPGLWHNAALNHLYGLFEVTDSNYTGEHKIYQVRGYDLANTTFIKSDTGWIVIDTLTSQQTAEAALELMTSVFGPIEIKGLVISHNHADHYGGMASFVTQEQVYNKSQTGKVHLIVPENFLKYVVSENLFAGNAMRRRAEYQFGTFLSKDAKGLVSSGLGVTTSGGNVSFVLPGDIITSTGQEMIVDGVRMIFQLTPSAEAPSDMNIFFPEQKALFLADNCVPLMHNLYTLRGAEVRDALLWADYLVESMELFGHDFEIAFQSHNWPRWGNANILEFLLLNTQVYRFIHDQTLHFANLGYNDEEIAEIMELPDGLNNSWVIQPNYGALVSNVKAVYQKYLGWYDGNPVNLNPLPDAMSAQKYVDYMGGSQAIIQKALQDYDNGEYRWVAEVVFKVVLAEPENMKARYLCADALEQLGYQSESGIWRNAYLSGSYELRHGQAYSTHAVKGSPDTRKSMSARMIFDYLGILYNGEEAQDFEATFDITLQDTGEQFQLVIDNGTVITFKQPGIKQPDLSITMLKEGLFYFTMKMFPPEELIVQTKGDISLLKEFLSALTIFDKDFTIMSNRLF